MHFLCSEGMVRRTWVPESTRLNPANKHISVRKADALMLADGRYACRGVNYLAVEKDMEQPPNGWFIYEGLPKELIMEMTEILRIENLNERYAKEKAVSVPAVTDGEADDSGNYKPNLLEVNAFKKYKLEEAEANADLEAEARRIGWEPGRQHLIGPLSDDPTERNYQMKDLENLVRQAIKKLPEKQRRLYYALYAEQMTETEYAVSIGVTPQAVCNMKGRLEKKFRKLCSEVGYRVPTAAELKAEKQETEKRRERYNAELKAAREESRASRAAKLATEWYYKPGSGNELPEEVAEEDSDKARAGCNGSEVA